MRLGEIPTIVQNPPSRRLSRLAVVKVGISCLTLTWLDIGLFMELLVVTISFRNFIVSKNSVPFVRLLETSYEVSFVLLLLCGLLTYLRSRLTMNSRCSLVASLRCEVSDSNR